MLYTSQVFGVSSNINNYSYVDRSNLDVKLERLLRRETHIAIKGPSKCGKSWLRQKCLTDAITVQCRLDMEPKDIYSMALSSLGISFNVQRSSSTTIAGSVSGNGKAKIPVVAEASIEGEFSGSHVRSLGVEHDYSSSIENLEFIATSINKSGKRLVIEDFHYLKAETRVKMAHDLKTLWDYHCFVVIIGIWTQTNLLTYMNPDLAGRIEEISITWTDSDLKKVIEKGTSALNIEIDTSIQGSLISDSFGNVGILQSLLLRLIEDEADISERGTFRQYVADPDMYNKAAKAYANQLDGLYQQFAKALSVGIRRRQKSTGIYALAMQAIVNASDNDLLRGYSRADIFSVTNRIEPRIQKGNLKTVLKKLVELQNPDSGRSLVISYDDSIDAVLVIDLQLLFYRKHHSLRWPWEELAEEARQLNLFETESDEPV